MKTLLDEQISVRFKTLFEGIEVFTVYDKGWDKLKNGDLRKQMESEGFKALVTADKNMSFQQNLTTLNFAIVIMDMPSLMFEYQEQLLPKIQQFLKGEYDHLPKIVQVTVESVGRGSKIDQFQKLVPPKHFLSL
ncbi:MAG: hypothetical protein MUC59_11510 [Saprospiraceae bacterium]|nr:hypothetical protein [Saprospiraceae bacterium]